MAKKRDDTLWQIEESHLHEDGKTEVQDWSNGTDTRARYATGPQQSVLMTEENSGKTSYTWEEVEERTYPPDYSVLPSE